MARQKPLKSPALAIATLSVCFILDGANPLHAQMPSHQPGGMTQPGAAQPGGAPQLGAPPYQPGGHAQTGTQPGTAYQPGATNSYQPGAAYQPGIGGPYRPGGGTTLPAPPTSLAPAPLIRLEGRLSPAPRLLPAIVDSRP